jgi:hypothetical protein
LDLSAEARLGIGRASTAFLDLRITGASRGLTAIVSFTNPERFKPSPLSFRDARRITSIYFSVFWVSTMA